MTHFFLCFWRLSAFDEGVDLDFQSHVQFQPVTYLSQRCQPCHCSTVHCLLLQALLRSSIGTYVLATMQQLTPGLKSCILITLSFPSYTRTLCCFTQSGEKRASQAHFPSKCVCGSSLMRTEDAEQYMDLHKLNSINNLFMLFKENPPPSSSPVPIF